MPSPIPANAYPATAPRPSNRDLFGQGASGQDMNVLGASQAGETGAAEATKGNPVFGADGFTFGDFLDIINPLQHIPIVSTIYRAVTGDKIDVGSRLAGGGLFGGPIGLVASMISGIVEEATGRDPGEHALAAVGIDIGPNANRMPETMVAEQAAPAIDPASQAPAAQQVAQTQPQLPAQALKLGVKMDEGAAGNRVTEEKKAQSGDAPKADGPIELPADLFQALKQTAAAQQAETKSVAANTASSIPVATGAAPTVQPRSAAPMQTNTAIQPAPDGRTWFPASPVGIPAPSRGVGAQPVTQQTVQARYGATRGTAFPSTPQNATAAAATMIQQGADPQQAEWANRATGAYQKYFDMQNEKNRRAGIVP